MTTPITDLIDDLVSQGVPWDVALKTAKKLEERLALTTSDRGPEGDRRKYERDRKAAYRARKVAESPGTSGTGGYIDRDNHQIQCEKETESKKPVPDVPDSDWPSDFLDQFWNAYPPQRRTEKVKVAKKLALLRRTGKPTWAKLMAGLERYKQTRDVMNGFAKGPMVWLNGGCWDDEIQTKGPNDGATGSSGGAGLGYTGIAAHIRAKRLAREIGAEDAAGDVRAGGRQDPPELPLVRVEEGRGAPQDPPRPHRR